MRAQIVEPAGARFAAQRRTDADHGPLEAVVESMVGAGDDANAVIEADLRFHHALLDAAHNELLSRMEVVIEIGLRIRDEIVHHAQHWPDSVPAHRAVLDAVRAGDDDRVHVPDRSCVVDDAPTLMRLPQATCPAHPYPEMIDKRTRRLAGHRQQLGWRHPR